MAIVSVAAPGRVTPALVHHPYFVRVSFIEWRLELALERRLQPVGSSLLQLVKSGHAIRVGHVHVRVLAPLRRVRPLQQRRPEPSVHRDACQRGCAAPRLARPASGHLTGGARQPVHGFQGAWPRVAGYGSAGPCPPWQDSASGRGAQISPGAVVRRGQRRARPREYGTQGYHTVLQGLEFGSGNQHLALLSRSIAGPHAVGP